MSAPFGAQFLAIKTSMVTNHSTPVPRGCNLTFTYTHPGQNGTLNVEFWLPPAEAWNGRFQAVGGGGWNAGRFPLSWMGMAGAVC